MSEQKTTKRSEFEIYKDTSELIQEILRKKLIITGLYQSLEALKIVERIGGNQVDIGMEIGMIKDEIFESLESLELLHIEDIDYDSLTKKERKELYWFYDMLIKTEQPSQINAMDRKIETNSIRHHWREEANKTS